VDGTSEQAVVTLSRRHFQLDSAQELLRAAQVTETSLTNDVYSKVGGCGRGAGA
jgi:hypothetical protein